MFNFKLRRLNLILHPTNNAAIIYIHFLLYTLIRIKLQLCYFY